MPRTMLATRLHRFAKLQERSFYDPVGRSCTAKRQDYIQWEPGPEVEGSPVQKRLLPQIQAVAFFVITATPVRRFFLEPAARRRLTTIGPGSTIRLGE